MTAAFTVYDAGQQPPPQNGPYTLGVLGDSRMAVDWNAILGRTDILVLAVPGQRISDWKANWQTNCQTMAATGIKKWICEWGKNDVDAGRAVADIGHDFQDVVTLIGAYCNGSRVGVLGPLPVTASRSEEHTSELQSLMRISYAVFCLKKKYIKKRYNKQH